MRALAFLLLFIPALACAPQTVDAISSSGEAGAGAAGQGGSGGGSGSGAGGGVAGTGGGGSGQAGSSDAGAPDGAGGEAGEEATLRSDALLHRYSFDGTGTVALDDKGGAHGTVIGTMAEGTLLLGGLGTGEYLDLPDNLVSGLGDATFEVWVTWSGGNLWQRLFDFGDNFEAPNGLLNGNTYLFLTPKADYSDMLRAAFSLSGSGEAELVLDATQALPEAELAHVALVVDDQNDSMSLYLNGSLENQVPFFDRLSGLNDVNNWLGKSQFETDAEFGGTIHEFRIYDAALDAAEIKVSFDAGPQAVFPAP